MLYTGGEIQADEANPDQNLGLKALFNLSTIHKSQVALTPAISLRRSVRQLTPDEACKQDMLLDLLLFLSTHRLSKVLFRVCQD